MLSHTIVITIATLLMTHSVIPSSICESKKDPSENDFEITSTSEYLELNSKHIESIARNDVPELKIYYSESLIEHNGFVYYSNHSGLFVQQENSTSTATIIDGFSRHTIIFLDKNFNIIYFGTANGLSVLVVGGRKANKISVTDGIAVGFGIVDNIGNVYFGSDGTDEKACENLFILRKDDQRLINIGGIEKSVGGYTIENIMNPNKIAVDSRNNIYVGAYSGRIYLIESGQTTATVLKDIKRHGGVTSVVVDSMDNVYFRTNHALYVLKNNGKKLTKLFDLIDDFNYFLNVDESDNLYFQFTSKFYVFRSQMVNASRLDTVTNSNDFRGASNFTNLQNIQIKNEILYFTSTYNGRETIFSLKPTETSLYEVHSTDNSIISLAIDNSNNIYFITISDEVQKLVPFVLRANSNIPIEIRVVTGHPSSVFSDNRNNVYFGSGNGLHVLPDGEVTPFKLRATESQVSTFVVDKNDNVYFGTDYDGAFVLKSGELEASKIVGMNSKYGSYVEVYGNRDNDVIFFKTGGALYKLNGGETFVESIIEGSSPDLFSSNCMKDTYYVQANDENSSIMSVMYKDKETTHVTDVVGQVRYIKFDSANNLYFITDTNQLHVLEPNQTISKVLAKNQKFTSLNVDRDDNVYVSTSDNEFYVARKGEIATRRIENIYGVYKHYLTNADDIFFLTATSDHAKELFRIRNKEPFESMFRNRNLGEIDNDEDETIFNVLNYLNFKDNYSLSKNKNRIVNKTSTSATILATKGKFTGSFEVIYAVRNDHDDTVTSFDLTKLLGKAIFFDHKTKNSFNFRNKMDIQSISISTEILKFSPVELEANSESISSVEFKQICFNKKKVANTSPLPQTVKVPECNYETKETISFQVINGLNEINNTAKGTVTSVLSSNDENIILNYINDNNDNNQNVTPKVTLSNDFNFSDLSVHSHEINLQNFREDEQEIIVPPKQRVLVNYSVRTFVSETKLNLKQKIRGTLVAKISHTDFHETIQLTIKEAMQTLKNYNLLPRDISINQDNSVVFNGRAKLIVKRESEPKIIRNFYNL